MANPITGIVSGTVKTAKNQLQDTARGFASVIPNPAKSVYGLGMGVGPLIRNIVQEINKPKKVSKDKEPATKKEQAATTAEIRKQNISMQTQMALSVSLLKDIRATLQKQLHAVNKAASLGVGDAGLVAGRMKSSTSSSKDSGDVISDLGGMGKDVLGTMSKMILGGIAVGGIAKIYQTLPQELKDETSKLIGGAARSISDNIIKNAGDMLTSAWTAEPVITALGGLAVAHVTGILGLVTKAAGAAIDSTKGAVTFGKGMNYGNSAEATKAAQAGATNMGGMGNMFRRMFGMEQMVGGKPLAEGLQRYQQMGEIGLKRAGYAAAEIDAIKQASAATSAAPATAGLASGSKALTAMKVIGGASLIGTAAQVGMGAYDYSKVNKELEQRKIDEREANTRKGRIVGSTGLGLAGGMYAGSKGAVAGAALGTMVLPGIGTAIGAIGGGVLGGVFGSWLGSSVGGFAGENVGAAVPTSQKPPAGSMGTSNTTNVSGGTIPGLDNQRLLDLVGKFESGGNYNIDNKVGFVGKYQVGAEALETAGLLRPGASKGRNRGPGSAIYDPASWNSGYTLDGFLNDPGLQDKVASTLMRSNYDQLVKSGVIGPNMSDADIASRLYTAWHGGVGGANALFQNGQAREDFLFKGVTTKTSADKMYAAWNGTGGGTLAGSPSSTTPATSSAATMAGGLSVGNISSPEAMIGSAFADVQDAFNSVASLISGQKIDINMSNIVQNAMQSSGQQSSIASPSRTEPQKTNVALDRAQFATGVKS